MGAIHLIFMILATWRITDVITTDKIFDWPRKKFPLYLWTCPRCVSIWIGVLTTALYFYAPFGNWPFALSWLLILHGQLAAYIQERTGRKIVVTVSCNNAISVNAEGIAKDEVPKILTHLVEMYNKKQTEVKKQA